MYRHLYFLNSLFQDIKETPFVVEVLFLLLVPLATAKYIPSATLSSPDGPAGIQGRMRLHPIASHRHRPKFAPRLTAIAPQSYIGQTISTHPTFSWFVPGTEPVLTAIRLYRYTPQTGRGALLVQTDQLPSTPGIMSWTLPADQPGLLRGQQYLWQVVLWCQSSPFPKAMTEALIEVVSDRARAEANLTATLALLGEAMLVGRRGRSGAGITLATVGLPLDTADLYGQAGLWYDAWRELTITAQRLGGEDARVSLLTDLINSEAAIGFENVALSEVRDVCARNNSHAAKQRYSVQWRCDRVAS
ncbi:MAG: DUF928 domain-containing protein [Cyanobacteria bacterium J06639_14]